MDSSRSRWCRPKRCGPPGMPAALGQDFFLAGYRVFTTFRAPTGRRLRGLRILRSDANRARMVTGGNLLTHYNYHRCTRPRRRERDPDPLRRRDRGPRRRRAADDRSREPGAPRGLAVRLGARGAPLRRPAAVHLRLRGGDARDHRDSGHARQLAARAGVGRRRAPVVLRSAGVPRLHAACWPPRSTSPASTIGGSAASTTRCPSPRKEVLA